MKLKLIPAYTSLCATAPTRPSKSNSKSAHSARATGERLLCPCGTSNRGHWKDLTIFVQLGRKVSDQVAIVVVVVEVAAHDMCFGSMFGNARLKSVGLWDKGGGGQSSCCCLVVFDEVLHLCKRKTYILNSAKGKIINQHAEDENKVN